MSSPAPEERKIGAEGAAFIPQPNNEESRPRPSKPDKRPSAYKKRSLASGYWGDIPRCEEPLRQVAAEEAQETFLHGLLDTPTAKAHRRPAQWFVSLVAHVIVVGAVVIVPIVFTQVIDVHSLQATYLAMPRPPAAPAPRPPAMQVTPTRLAASIRNAALTAPSLIPKKILQLKDEEAPDINPGGVAGGVTGGEGGGVLGGVLGGSAVAPPPPAQIAKKSVYRVGGVVKPPREISRVEPTYPILARHAHVEGVVVVNAVIDENGDVVQARAVSGPGLLIASALAAVLRWKYEPTYLDGMPVSISMEVQVNFQLH
jgi:periplasmic protein TonB